MNIKYLKFVISVNILQFKFLDIDLIEDEFKSWREFCEPILKNNVDTFLFDPDLT